jgi:predicted 3-demethylubiquinone-9 3-methyltransferase (glyoxalase superfamily)
MPKITPFLWYDNNAEEAAKFYLTVFDNSRITKTTRYDEESSKAAGRPAGSVMTIEFELDGQKFVAINGGPHFKFTEAVSFVIECENQEKVDYFWEKLSAGGGQESQCGWLKDKFGLSWQVVPATLSELFQGTPESSKRVMHAMLQMKKLDVNVLKQAAAAGK